MRPNTVFSFFLLLISITILDAASATRTGLVEKADAIMQRSRDELRPQLYAEAKSLYQEAIKLDTRDINAMIGLAWVYNSEHNFHEGIRWAKRALEIESSLPSAYALIGDAELEYGNYDQALAEYQKALDLRPDLSSYSRAGIAAWITGHEDNGEELMRLAISAGAPTAENTAWCKAQLGTMLFQQGRLDEAIELIGHAVRSAPNNPLVLASMAKLLRAKGDIEKATQLFKKSSNISPNHEALSCLVEIYTKAGRIDLADTYHAKLIDFHQSHHGTASDYIQSSNRGGFASYQLALFWARNDMNLNDALGQALAAYTNHPNIQAAHALAWCFYKKGKYKQAKKYIDHAMRLNTPSAEMSYHAGMISLALGNKLKAKQLLTSALQQNPYFDATSAESANSIIKKITDEKH